MGLCEDPSTHFQNQARGKNPQRMQRARHPRSRVCLLKGCGQTFRPKHPLTRYCSEPCREQARQWREWKARHRYRQSDSGKQKRQAQSRRYRLSRKARKKQKAATVNGARVIPTKFFFRAPAIGLDVTRSSSAAEGRRCNGSVARCVAVPWNGFWSGRGAGESGGPPGDENPSI
jgi:hypothetical protein